MNNKEQIILKNLGYIEADFEQIEQAKRKTTYENEKGEKLTKKEVLKILGLENYLIALSRSAFHWTSYNNDIYFDSSKLFE